MLDLPGDVLTSRVLVHLSIRDLQAVNVAFTSTPTHRARIKELWKSYPHEYPDEVGVTLDDLKWLRSVEVRVVSISSYDKAETTEVFEFVRQNFPLLRRLKIMPHLYYTDEEACNDDLLVKLASGCPLLEEFSTSYGLIGDEGILAIVQKCTQLHTLKILDNVHITDAAIETICMCCRHLKHIDVSDCYNLTDASLIAIANTFPNIQTLYIQDCNFTDDGILSISNMCHELRSVAVRFGVTSRGFTALWTANPNLMDVDVSCNDFISDDIIQLAQCCPLLHKLNMSLCEGITDAAVIAVAEHCPQLRSLDISECFDVSDASLIALGQHCHELKLIDISLLKSISDVGIVALAAGCPLLQEFYAYSTNITDAGVVALARGCRDLRKIRVTV